jgi:hypothetical protein
MMNETDDTNPPPLFQFGAVDAETRGVMKNRVNPGVSVRYASQNQKFIVWLFDNREHYGALVKPALLEELAVQQENDRAQRTKAGRPSKGRDHVRATCREWLKRIDADEPGTHPIELADLTFQIYTRYLATFKKTVTKRSRGGADDETVEIRLSTSAYDGATSSLSHLYTECGLDKHEVSKDLWAKLKVYKAGSRRTSAREKKDLGLSTVEGKKHLPFAAYRHLAQILFESEKSEHIYAHAFLVLEWNLISRAEFLVDAKIDIVSFTKDALIFAMGVTKTDQEGTKNVDHPWHVYSCPEFPEICAHLAFARHIMASPTILNGGVQLFEGKSQYERFNTIFRDIVASPEHREVFASYGISPGDFGTHSIRKGAATHVSTGSTASPPIASICLRANWAMPGVLSRYIKYENAGDQFVGKCVSGRRRNSKTFAASPSYWDFSADGRDAKEACEHRLHRYLRDLLPDQAKDNLKIFAVHKMVVAVVVYHRDYLAEHLHADSILRSSSLWNEEIPFEDKVVVKHPWDASDDTPEITGLPPDIVLLAELESMHRDMAALKADLMSSFESTLIAQLDQREVGGSGFARGNEIIQKLETLLEKVSEVSRTAQVGATAPPPPHDDLPEIGESGGFISDEDEDDVVLLLDEPERMSPKKRARIIQQRTQEQLSVRKLKVGFHHGKFNPLPASWRYPPGLTLIQLIHLWLIGSPKEHVPPFRKIPTSLIAHFDKQGKVKSKMNIVMREVEYFARKEGVWLEGRWTSPAVTKMWSTIWPLIEPNLRTLTRCENGEISDEKSRQGQIAWRTCYNKLLRHGKNWVPSKNNMTARNMSAAGANEDVDLGAGADC